MKSPTKGVESILNNKLKLVEYKFLRIWLDFPVTKRTWELIGKFVPYDGTINEALEDYDNDKSEPFIFEKSGKHQETPRFQFSSQRKHKMHRHQKHQRNPLSNSWNPIHQTPAFNQAEVNIGLRTEKQTSKHCVIQAGKPPPLTEWRTHTLTLSNEGHELAFMLHMGHWRSLRCRLALWSPFSLSFSIFLSPSLVIFCNSDGEFKEACCMDLWPTTSS